jgi:sn-1 stearoyl-lipid 9-desaturase
MLEWVDAISFWRDRTRLLPAAFALFHFITFLVFVSYLIWHATWLGCLTVFLLACFIGTVYNTVWYHRYCSHQAFKFSSIWFARLFLWTNPICYREECYVIPHRVHHSKSDEPGDPYGPHLGWLGSYLASETQQKTNRHISAQHYDRLRRSLGHCGFLCNDYQAFQRTGSVERVGHYLARVVTANLLWNGLAWAIAGWQGVMVWISAVFLFTFVLRDFNYRGHSSFVGTSTHGEPVNQMFYGLIAGEWHKNHHDHPRLARSGLRWWQVDVPYGIIRLMKACGLVTKCNAKVPL